MRTRLSVLVTLAALSAVGCNRVEPCGPTTCAGCCDTTGECRGGSTDDACGTAGLLCSVCTTGSGCFNNGCGPKFSTTACDPTAVTCTDQSLANLDFKTNIASGAVTTVADGGVFSSTVDARGGGLSPTESYVYVRFTDTGLEKVSVSDEAALSSVAWDLAFRRYVLRLNSGVSGPSCVQAARAAPGTTFEALTAADTNLVFRTEAYFTSSCVFVNDGSGLDGPGTALASFWSYQNCVRMTGNVYVVRLANQRLLKFQVQSYYEPTQQAQCDSTGMISGNVMSAQFRVRWAFL